MKPSRLRRLADHAAIIATLLALAILFLALAR